MSERADDLIRVTVLLFAVACDLVGQSAVTLTLPSGATTAELREALVAQSPALRPIAASLLFAQNNEYLTAEATILPGLEVACIPPVSGG